MSAATARLVESIDGEVQTIETADGGHVIALVLPGAYRPAEAEQLADEFHAALTRALEEDLGPLKVTAERLPAEPPTTTEKETSR